MPDYNILVQRLRKRFLLLPTLLKQQYLLKGFPLVHLTPGVDLTLQSVSMGCWQDAPVIQPSDTETLNSYPWSLARTEG